MARSLPSGRQSWSTLPATRTYRNHFLIRPAAAMLGRGRKVGPGFAPGEFGGCNVTDALAEKIDVSSSNGGPAPYWVEAKTTGLAPDHPPPPKPPGTSAGSLVRPLS